MDMDGSKKAIINAAIMAGLAAIPIWIAYGSIDYTMVKAVIGTFLVTFLTLCARYFRPPKSDTNGESECSDPEKKDTQILGMLWV